MAKEVKKKKLSSDGSSVREKLLARKKKLAEKGTSSAFIFPKNGTTRVRILSAGPDNEPALELVRFYVNGHSVFSPETFEEPCPFIDEYKRLKKSKHEDENNQPKKSWNRWSVLKSNLTTSWRKILENSSTTMFHQMRTMTRRSRQRKRSKRKNPLKRRSRQRRKGTEISKPYL